MRIDLRRYFITELPQINPIGIASFQVTCWAPLTLPLTLPALTKVSMPDILLLCHRHSFLPDNRDHLRNFSLAPGEDDLF